MLASL
jgi:hypothetical protein